MKKIFVGILAIGLMGLSLTTSSVEQREELKIVKEEVAVGINFFHGTWAEALVKAKKENKLIFLDSYASWCGPCKMMARNTFTDAEVGTFFNKNFINVKMDMEKNADGPRLSRKFGLTAYPSLYFVNGSETIAHKSLGYQKPNQLIELGKVALTKK